VLLPKELGSTARYAIAVELVDCFEGINVRNRIHVQLISNDVDRGFIDLSKSTDQGGELATKSCNRMTE
jgi:hypothetical protein